MPKYLDLTGLTTFKSKLDTTYAKKADVYDKTAADGLLSAKANSADVYTKAQVDSAIAGVEIPTIVVALSQVISQDPVTQIQLTDEQYQILSDNKQVIIDMTAFGMGAVVADYVGTTSSVGENYIVFKLPYLRSFYLVRIDTSTKVAEVHFGTVTITQIDIDGAGGDYGKVVTANGDDVDWKYPYRMSYLNTAPSSANNTGTLQIVVLNSEPATRYEGYFYIITESN